MRRFFRNLDHITRAAFPPQGGGSDDNVKIDQMSPVAVGVFPLAPRFADICTVLAQSAIANGSAQSIQAAVPEDTVRMVVAASVFHDDPVARNTWISIYPRTGINGVHVIYQGATPTNTVVTIPRSIILTAGQRLGFDVFGIAAGQHMTVSYVAYDFPEGMVQPGIPS